jgi:uncharacterized protein (DUF1330 family)
MQYVIWGAAEFPAELTRMNGAMPLAAGDMLVLEGPWPLGSTALAYVADDDVLATLPPHASTTSGAFAVAGFEAPGDGGAFVIAAHRMLDAEAFRPYAEAIPGLLKSFGVRSLARGGTVTRIAGAFAPDRGVVLEFPSVEAVVEFYTSPVYAPLLDLRLRTTDPRFVVLARDGKIPAPARERAEAFLAARARPRL